MNQRTLVFLLGFVMGLPLCRSAHATQVEKPKKLNVLFIAVDDLRPELGCYGRPVETPNLDRLAKSGVRFERAYCQYPLCNPSRTSLLTSLYPTTTGVKDNTKYFRAKFADAVTLPQLFRQNGYASVRVGKIFHGGIDDDASWVEGAEQRKEQKPRTPEENAARIKQSDRFEAVAGKGEKLLDYQTAEKAVTLMEKYRNQPFFLAVGFARPHSPLVAPKEYFDRYDPNKVALPTDFAPRPMTGPGVPPEALAKNGDLFINRDADKKAAQEMIAAYQACVTYVDAQVGKVLDALYRLGLRENTVIVFFGDHGYHLGEKGKWSKHGSLYEVGVRVPLLIAAPTEKGNGKSCPRPVELIDLYPTLADLCRLPVPKNVQGNSLVPLLQNPEASWDHPAFSVADRGKLVGRSVRTQRYRYTEWSGDAQGAELYDHDTDPHELRNLAGDPANREILTALGKVLREKLR